MKRNRKQNKKHSTISIFFPLISVIGIAIVFALSSFYEKSWSYNWNGIRMQIKDSVQVMQYGSVSGPYIGIDGRRYKLYDTRRWIQKNATISELKQLTEFPNGTIKAIAYEALVRKRNFEQRTDYLIKAIKDTEYSVPYQAGCVGYMIPQGDYLIDIVLNLDEKLMPRLEWQADSGFSESERLRILWAYTQVE
ncbi:hypothetical protein POV27_09755 [Aureisphaera galaxeae]|uniref:hypothetical protein n=1 Tax=Aureisphaera galaxeae TaxID=1538023 RepID=UPI00235082EA|nr:hypothetical protein [Aureisphaera galaxeae]MDC8004336.1 hypothetical protein [Aureisphaera galaxeae]